jgi:glycosyltransferase involved in cell wall biosynthesis
LLLVGQGSAVENPIISDDLAGRVVWLERRPQTDLAAFIVHSLAGVVPISGQAGRTMVGVMPLKLFEILACGRPAIVTDLPSQAEFVRTNNCGVVVPVDGAHEIAVAVADLAADPKWAAELGKRGHDIVAAQYSWDFLASQADVILRRLVRH